MKINFKINMQTKEDQNIMQNIIPEQWQNHHANPFLT